MAAPGIPSNFNVQTANQQNLVSWSLSVGASSYIVQRSLDNITFSTISTISGSPLATSYLDTAVTIGTQYWYQVAASNGTASSFTTPISVIPTPAGEMCLSQIRLASQQTADRVNSNFVTLPEWNRFINLAMFELYDLLVTVYEDLYVAQPAYFSLNGIQNFFALPNGSNTFQDGTGTNFIPRPFYKLIGVDLAVNTAQNAWVTINKFNFIDRNNYLYPNSSSTIYGVYNIRYRLLGANIEFIPNPAGNQQIRLWYIPRLIELLQDTDITDTGISGWIRYVIVRAAKYALDKEESDTTKLTEELIFLKQRIEESASNRDAGQPDTISDTRQGNWSSGWGPFGGWGGAGWALLFIPSLLSNYIGDTCLINPVFFGQLNLWNAFSLVSMAYFFYLLFIKFSSNIMNSVQKTPFLINHIPSVLLRSAKPKMVRVNTARIVTSMTNHQKNGSN